MAICEMERPSAPEDADEDAGAGGAGRKESGSDIDRNIEATPTLGYDEDIRLRIECRGTEPQCGSAVYRIRRASATMGEVAHVSSMSHRHGPGRNSGFNMGHPVPIP